MGGRETVNPEHRVLYLRLLVWMREFKLLFESLLESLLESMLESM